MALKTEETTFTRDVLGRYICSTWEEATTDSSGIDVVVIGGGLYGGYCAAKVYELAKRQFGDKFKGLRVLVLEAGRFVVPEHSQDIPNLGFFDPGITNPQSVGSGSKPETRNEVWGVGWRSNQNFVGQAYCVGGKGIFWGGWCPRLQAADLAHWPPAVRAYLSTVNAADPVGFRPIQHQDLVSGSTLRRGDPLTGYEAVEYELGVVPVDDFVFDPVQTAGPGPRRVGLNESIRVFLDQRRAAIDGRITQVLPAPIAVQTQSFISGLFALDKYSSVPALTAAVRDDHGDGREANLRAALVPNCHVVRLGFREDPEAAQRGTRVVNRIFVRVDGQDRTLELGSHCQVVMALSAIESTRLALESCSLAGSGLRAAGDELMGRNFMVHLRFDIAFDIDRASFAGWVKTQWPGMQLAEVLQLAAAHVQCEGSNGRYQYQLYAATNNAGPDAEMYRLVPDIDIQRQIGNNFQSDKIRFVLRASGEVEGGRLRPFKDAGFDYIDLAGDADVDTEFGHRRAWVQFNRGDHFDDPIWQEMHDTAHAIARALNGGQPPIYREDLRNSTDYTIDAVKRQQGVGTTFHDAGTLWMGDDPDRSVCDSNGHLHHVTNLYCSDQALFTTVGSANPVLTGVALSRRVASDIVRRHAGFSGALTLASLQPQSLLPSAGWKQVPYDGMRLLDSANGGLLETDPNQGIGFYYLPVAMADFDMAIDWKAFRTYRGSELVANSGVLLRIADPGGVDFSDPAQFNAFYDSVTEIQIDDNGKRFTPSTGQSVFGDSRFKTGAIYGVAPATEWAGQVAAPDGEGLGNRYWNTMEISARGPMISVILNGRPVCTSSVPPAKRRNGFIALQFHTGRVQFRNLRLNRLS